MDLNKLQEIFENYKNNFNNRWEDEKYKWENIKQFQDNWNIDAENFVEMLEKSIPNSNLLNADRFYPRGMIIALANIDTEKVRLMFHNLYNEQLDLKERITNFIQDAEEIRKESGEEKWKNHYQSENVVSIYLWLKYPNKYYIYKSRTYKTLKDLLKYKTQNNVETIKPIECFNFYNEICDYINKDTDFKEKYFELTNDIYRDESLHTLVNDIGFYVYQKNKIKKESRNFFEKILNENNIKFVFDKNAYNVDIANKSYKIIIRAYNGNYTFIAKTQLPELKDDIFVAIVWWNNEKPESIYLIPTTEWNNKNSNIFVEKNYNGLKSKPEWGINLSDNKKEQLDPYEISAVIGNLLNDESNTQSTEEDNTNNKKDIQYWWLIASPKIFKFSDIEIEEEQYYTLLNENGNQRRIYRNFMAAKKGDLVIGYESTPVKQIVALGEITNRDSEKLYFKKTENLLNPISYSDIQDVKELQNMEYKGSQGSLFKLTKEEYNVLVDIIREVNPQNKQNDKKPYSKNEFLKSVYINEEKYDCIKSVLEHKKNIILQGAPGVGKTYCARKLAYSIMEEINDDRIEFIQFHQNYSYEDFVMGYKPTQEGFSLEKGVFYKFCKKAANDPDKKFFFIIDEINRGNLSKIFGELLMLIENDYRGHKIPLAYDATDCFAVPKNLYIIGLMNTADRSLSLIDYALRRRFSFIDISPAFDNKTFQKYQNELKNEKFNKLINVIVDLNKTISDVSKSGLGKGFCIGHSYFCNFETDKLNDIMLKEIVECDIIPMINEYWFDEEQLANEWINKLTEAIK